MENLVKQIIIYTGIPAIVACLIYIGRKLQILDDLKKTVEKIKHNLKVISDVIINSPYIKIDPSKLQTYSPLRLTDKGLNYLKDELKFIGVFENHKDDFFSAIESEEPKTRYDVETAAIKSVIYLSDKDYFESIKNYLYNNPKESLNTIAATVGVYIRDKYLEEHPEIR